MRPASSHLTDRPGPPEGPPPSGPPHPATEEATAGTTQLSREKSKLESGDEKQLQPSSDYVHYFTDFCQWGQQKRTAPGRPFMRLGEGLEPHEAVWGLLLGIPFWVWARSRMAGKRAGGGGSAWLRGSLLFSPPSLRRGATRAPPAEPGEGAHRSGDAQYQGTSTLASLGPIHPRSLSLLAACRKARSRFREVMLWSLGPSPEGRRGRLGLASWHHRHALLAHV